MSTQQPRPTPTLQPKLYEKAVVIAAVSHFYRLMGYPRPMTDEDALSEFHRVNHLRALGHLDAFDSELLAAIHHRCT